MGFEIQASRFRNERVAPRPQENYKKKQPEENDIILN
jgi:hypothetical protein